MTPETLKRLEELYDKWCNECPTQPEFIDVARDVMDLLPNLIAAMKERDAFAVNMDYSVRLGIATATEKLQKELDVANKRLKVCAEDRDAAAAERDQLAEAIKTPEAVWTNMLRGTIARPVALQHYEECKAGLEKLTGLEGELEEAHAKVEVLRGERDAAQKACAEMGEWINATVKNCSVFSDPPILDCGKGYIKAESLRCFKCGDGHTPLYCLNCAREGCHHEREILPLVEALNQIRDNHALCETDAAVVEQALAHWEKVKWGAK